MTDIDKTIPLPIYDFENDDKLSDARKAACRVAYQDMSLHHIDKIFSSGYAYDKKTGEPIAKKPRSLHELVWCMLQSQMVISAHVMDLENAMTKLEQKLLDKGSENVSKDIETN